MSPLLLPPLLNFFFLFCPHLPFTFALHFLPRRPFHLLEFYSAASLPSLLSPTILSL
ncbi:hypothetical protein K457DRAFT_131764 [Linnemannia elongata AG-77]|uniref:Uncharacterized protein n=1 Tax=Linnemannia elongata AG-77 TaxID=1314771 RepID=A0A197KIX4_9FUNG|nr:hypothetical protein K457DRAFT_131764 [Linnemannia elongata AG-77]